MSAARGPDRIGVAAAWAAHLLTSSGVVVAFLALLAIERDEPGEALLWLLLALAIDGVDGTLARAAKVRERLPRIDGDALDLVIDYLTYVFLPVLLIWRGDHLPPSLALGLVAAILTSSLYVFARRDMKTKDGYFRGFPALWNVIAFYFFVLQPDPAIAATVVAALVIMSFAPVHTVHPFRVRDYGLLLPAVAVVSMLSTGALLVASLGDNVRGLVAAVALGSAAVLIGMGLLRTVRGARPAQ